MRTLLPENLCAHRRGAIEELIKGRARDTAAQLQILFAKPTGDHDRPEELLVKLLTSVTESLFQVSLSSCEDCECEVTQIPNQVGSLIGDQRLVNSGESCKRPAAEDRRGCYKRRKISEISMEVLSTTNEDGHAWRKYGQTKIPEAQFPMCYFGCIHEFDQGCQATKRVQRIQEAPHMYRTTYFGHHTCRSYLLNNPSQNPLLEAHLRSFSSKTFSDSESHSGSYRSFPTIEISTQYTSSHPSSASSVRSFSSETISTQDSESYARSFSSEMIPTQYISSCPSFASSVRKECEVGKIMHILHHRRSESLSQFNLLDYCLHPRAKWYESIVGFFGLANILDRMEYVETVEVTEDLRHFIFKELKQKSETADDLETAKKMSSARGWALWYEGRAELQRWIEGCDFDESLLLWNIATELCFNTDESSTRTNHGSGTIATNPNSDDNKKFRHMSKLLSDYMLYLLIVESSMISNLVGIGQTRFRDTCDEAKRFFHTRKIEEPKNSFLDIFIFRKCRFCGNQSDEGQQQSQTSCCKGEKGSEKLKIRACKSILDVHVAVDPITIKGDSSNSVLFDACMLAKELKKIESKRMWEIISKVWVEMLSYAACSTKANIHAAQLSKGGQLMTLVWLLMVHMGLVDVFPDI